MAFSVEDVFTVILPEGRELTIEDMEDITASEGKNAHQEVSAAMCEAQSELYTQRERILAELEQIKERQYQLFQGYQEVVAEMAAVERFHVGGPELEVGDTILFEGKEIAVTQEIAEEKSLYNPLSEKVTDLLDDKGYPLFQWVTP